MGELFVVGIGPGGPEYMTREAEDALERAEVFFGFGTYLDLLKESFPDKDYRPTGMGMEIDRCREALSFASKEGACAAIISGGDPGIYGMAGPVEELLPQYPRADIRVIAGVSAANCAAAILGAPLMNDFCVISLSDRLTPWELIEKRLKAACQADMVISIYNPMSKHRPDNLKKACDILLDQKKEDTACGWVKNAGRKGMEKKFLSLTELRDEELDMFTVVFVGNSYTEVIEGRLVTKRGYGERLS